MRFHNTITIVSTGLGAIINAATHYATGWGAIGYSMMYGLFPLLALLALLIASSFFSKLTMKQKLAIAIAVAYALLVDMILLGTRPAWLGVLFPSVVWLLPLLVWNFLVQWFRRRRPLSDHQAQV